MATTLISISIFSDSITSSSRCPVLTKNPSLKVGINWGDLVSSHDLKSLMGVSVQWGSPAWSPLNPPKWRETSAFYSPSRSPSDRNVSFELHCLGPCFRFPFLAGHLSGSC